jgi:hypothetical protein
LGSSCSSKSCLRTNLSCFLAWRHFEAFGKILHGFDRLFSIGYVKMDRKKTQLEPDTAPT